MAYQLAMSQPPLFKVAVFVVLLTIGIAPIGGCNRSPTPVVVPPATLLANAQAALKKAKFLDVETIVKQIPRTASQWQAGQLLAGEAASKDERLEAALVYYTAAAETDPETSDGQLATFSAADVHLELGQLSAAEPKYRAVLELQPGNGITNERMAFLLAMTGRRWEALNHYFVLIKGGDADFRELSLAADVGRAVEQAEFLEKCLAQRPDDKLVRLAVATNAFTEGEGDAQQLLQAIVDSDPTLTPAQSMLGELLIEDAIEERFLAWHDSLSASADDSPDIWFVRGLWARKQGDLTTAAACFWQTVVRTPFHRRAFYMLGQVLVALNDEQAKPIVAYSQKLIDLTQSVDQVLISDGKNQKAFRRTAETLESLGRTWEACAWAVRGREYFPTARWHADMLRRHGHKLNNHLARIEPELNPVLNKKAAPVPEFNQLVAKVAGRQQPISRAQLDVTHAKIQFDEIQGVPFQYFNGEDPSTKGARTFEQTGGGVAILDFDLDNVPDLFLPQGAVWKSGDARPTMTDNYHDTLFRNVAGKSFQDVSVHLGGPDSGFGQGCTAGDFNNDGFPDLYVANTGRNGLYENMGDGTFTNVTAAAGITDESWTVSTMLCDLNADGLPDIFDVNYLTGDKLFEKICNGRACSPTVFAGAPDRLLINLGDGRFKELSNATPQVGAKGMGILAFETEPNRRPTLFVSNDQVANFLLSNQAATNPQNIALINNAVTSGLAFNENGSATACMGIAADDWDGNGLTDLFVTNYHNEANTFFQQDVAGLFVDSTRSVGLHAASILSVGWGTQSLDADLDGQPDLVVANGHLDDYRDEGGEYHMKPQFFHNRGGRFTELTATEVGGWFGEKRLGRGLATIDWNLDGLPDFIVSNMNAPVSVMKNTSSDTGHFLRFKLHATQTARDAIGSRVSLKFDNRVVERQLMAGDGYMASNERVVAFGIGGSQSVDEVTIRWPSGATSQITLPPIDSTLNVVEGMNSATRHTPSQITSIRFTVTQP